MMVIEADLNRELLSVIYRGHVVPKDFVDTLADFKMKLDSMPEGFRLLTDLRDLDTMDYQCARHIDQYMDLIDCKGVSTVVRIVPDPKKDIGFLVMSQFHYKQEVNIVTCETQEEAFRVLEA